MVDHIPMNSRYVYPVDAVIDQQISLVGATSLQVQVLDATGVADPSPLPKAVFLQVDNSPPINTFNSVFRLKGLSGARWFRFRTFEALTAGFTVEILVMRDALSVELF